uniref:Uncharacterized protein n=1 Tax=Leersia perrieri TaxID=77586 RepID=A0A0D9Y121_9ORYZ
MGNHNKLLQFLRPVDTAGVAADDDEDPPSMAPSPMSSSASPYVMSPWVNLPGIGGDGFVSGAGNVAGDKTGLIGSLVKENGHIYSLAAAGDLLYTGTDSKNVRVWKDRREFAGFKSGSGLVKAIVVAGDGRIYTGHQDGKIRVWRSSETADGAAAVPRRVGSLPRLAHVLRAAVRPAGYIDTGRRRNSTVWIRHFDAVSCLSLDAGAGILYSASWDRSFKAWRVSDSRCLDSVAAAHDDAVNTVAAAGFDALVFTGSADGAVKVWRREVVGPRGATRHAMERVLRRGDGAVTAVAVAAEARVVYVASSDGAVTHWQFRRRHGAVGGGALPPPRNGGVMRGHKTAAVLCLAVAGRVVASGSADRTICVWRREEGAEHVRLAVLAAHTGPVKCVAVDEENGDGDGDGGGERRWVVYSGSLDGSVKVWRVSSTPDATAQTPARMTPAAASAWKRTPPSPLAAWTPYAAARRRDGECRAVV